MSDNENIAKTDLPTLRQMSEKLLALVDEIHAATKFTEEDHLGFMAANFLSKQHDHLQSIILLEPCRDVILIARSMIEGLCQLLWAAKDPSVRPFKWRTFSCIEDWRNMQKFLDRGISIDSEKRAVVEARLKTYGDMFLSKATKQAIKEGRPLPKDPYYRDWRC